MGSVVIMHWFGTHTSIDTKVYFFVVDSNKLFALLVAITSFCWFKEVKIPQIPIINIVASTTFGVFLIHTSSNTMRQWLWKEIVDVPGHFTMGHYVAYSIIVVLVVFSVCSVVDYFRQKTLEKWIFNKFDVIYHNSHLNK